MSNSYKKHPGGGVANSTGQALFRSQENRAKRRYVKQKLYTEQYEDLPHEKEYGNEWSSPRDGKQYWINYDIKWMRK